MSCFYRIIYQGSYVTSLFKYAGLEYLSFELIAKK